MMTFDPEEYDLEGDYAWLNDSVVEHRIHEANGRWYVTMVFINSEDPNQLLLRPIDNYPSKQKAELFAGIFQRQIRRDPRGNNKLKR